jgi:hypothetical protein
MVMSFENNAGENSNIKICNKFYESVVKVQIIGNSPDRSKF